MRTIIFIICWMAYTSAISATPIVTNDPRSNANVPFEIKKKLACRIYASRLQDGSAVTGTTGGVRMSNGEYNYFFYLQDVLDFCVDNIHNNGA